MAFLLLVGSAVPLPPRLNPDFGPSGPDKLLHLLGHAGFTAAFLSALCDDPDARGSVVAFVASTVFGVGTELLQESIPGREFEWWDVVAGVVGTGLGAAYWRRRVAEPPRP